MREEDLFWPSQVPIIYRGEVVGNARREYPYSFRLDWLPEWRARMSTRRIRTSLDCEDGRVIAIEVDDAPAHQPHNQHEARASSSF
ncbi:MAG: hypothetical protein ABJA02_08650 [Acidobacteriota bacterium]